MVKVQVVHIDECPNSAAAVERVRSTLDAIGLADVPVESVLVRTTDEAESRDVLGAGPDPGALRAAADRWTEALAD